jgi:hypothetical protein
LLTIDFAANNQNNGGSEGVRHDFYVRYRGGYVPLSKFPHLSAAELREVQQAAEQRLLHEAEMKDSRHAATEWHVLPAGTARRAAAALSSPRAAVVATAAVATSAQPAPQLRPQLANLAAKINSYIITLAGLEAKQQAAPTVTPETPAAACNSAAVSTAAADPKVKKLQQQVLEQLVKKTYGGWKQVGSAQLAELLGWTLEQCRLPQPDGLGHRSGSRMSVGQKRVSHGSGTATCRLLQPRCMQCIAAQQWQQCAWRGGAQHATVLAAMLQLLHQRLKCIRGS